MNVRNPLAAYMVNASGVKLDCGEVLLIYPLTLRQLPYYFDAMAQFPEDLGEARRKLHSGNGGDAEQDYASALNAIISSCLPARQLREWTITDMEKIVDAIIEVNAQEIERGITVASDNEDKAEWNWEDSAIYLVRKGHNFEDVMDYPLAQINSMITAHVRQDVADQLNAVTAIRVALSNDQNAKRYINRISSAAKRNENRAAASNSVQ